MGTADSPAELPPSGTGGAGTGGYTEVVRGRSVFVREYPAPADGEPAMFVHGLGGSSTNWDDVGELLSDRLSAEAIDLPGFGRSEPPTGRDYSMNGHARTVVETLERRGRGPVHLVGNSMGGLVSLMIAAYRPDLVRTLTLVSPVLPFYNPWAYTEPRFGLLLVPGTGMRLAKLINELDPAVRTRAVLRLCFGDPTQVPEERLAEAVAEMAERQSHPWASEALVGSLRSIVGSFLRFGRGYPWRLAARVQAPSLVVWGDLDRLVSVRIAPRLARILPGRRLLVLPGAGHVSQLERPEETAKAMRGLLDGTSDNTDWSDDVVPAAALRHGRRPEPLHLTPARGL